MGLDSPFELGADMVVNLPSDVYVVANPDEIERRPDLLIDGTRERGPR